MNISNNSSEFQGENQPFKLPKRCENCLRLPSEVNCMLCLLNMNATFSDESLEDGSLDLSEIMAKYDNDLDNMNRVMSLFLRIYSNTKEKRRNVANRIIKRSMDMENGAEVQLEIQKKTAKYDKNRLPVSGLKHIIAKKIGYFFFNPHNKSGLHMSRIYEDAVTSSVVKLLEHEDGSSFSIRTTGDNIAEGGKMKPTEGFNSNK